MKKIIIYYRDVSSSPAPDDEVSVIGGAPQAGTDRLFASQAPPVSGIKYRYSKFYLRNWNNSGSPAEDKFSNVLLWMFWDPHAVGENTLWSFALGLETEANQTTIQGTAPAGVTFKEQDGSIKNGVVIGDIGQYLYSVGIWVRFTIPTGSLASSYPNYYIRWIGSGPISDHDDTT